MRGDNEIPPKINCCDCIHERGIGFDAWCGLGLQHYLDIPHVCAAFYHNKDYKNKKNNKITNFEFKDDIIILWKKDVGHKFTKQQFLNFLNSHIKDHNI